MSLWSKLFGGGSSVGGGAAAEAEDYNGFRITPAPVKDTGGYRIAATIEKEIAGETKRHDLIRADVCSSLDEATKIATAKAKNLIDEQGETIFN